FLFSPQRARSPVKSLSGGERNRLLLARLFTRPSNVMVLDEPTNDLDIETLELLEDLLQGYTGTLFLVSHDREFLDNVVTQVVAFEGNGLLREYVGGYADWMLAKEQIKSSLTPEARIKVDDKTKKNKAVSLVKKLSYQESRELFSLPDKIAALEQEQTGIMLSLNNPTLYRDNLEEAKALQRRSSEIEKDLINCLERWEELESKSGKIGG